jgi:hypothetical protein
MALSKDEIAFLRDTRDITDMMNTPGWKVYSRILEAQIQSRMDLIMKPGHDFDKLETQMGPNGPVAVSVQMDGVTKYGALEHIKGAYNGLKLALTTPQTMVDEANRLRNTSPDEEDSK